MLELSITSDTQPEFTIITATTLIGALILWLGMIWGVWQTAMQKRRVGAGVASSMDRPILRYIRGLQFVAIESVLILLTCIHFALWLVIVQSAQRDRLSLSMLGVGAIGSVFLWRWLCHQGEVLRLWKRAASLVICGVQVVGLALLLHIFSEPWPELRDPSLIPGEVVAKTEWLAMTDEGNPVELYERRLPHEKFAEFVDSIRPQIASLSKQAIRRNSAIMVSNCHGWVFARGEHLVRNEDVQTILDQNGYRIQTLPKIGDVVVYKNLEDQIVHTGVVCGLLANDQALVESKWGIEGCFVHLADQQPYSQDFTFWRSARGTHALNIYHRDAIGAMHPVHTELVQDASLDD